MIAVRRSILSLAGLAGITLASMVPARAEGTLTVCLDENVPPLSYKQGKDARGFDLGVAQAVALRLGRSLAVQWFESKLDNDSNPTQQMNALLSDGRCQLVAGYPLVASTLGEPEAERSRLPGYDGAKPEDRRRWVRLHNLIASRAYRFDP
ncbi:MAG: hypothetical protein JO212_05070, partial [Acetobacteraceae bacterium]|nr:hypothetical protein [Acetobacteraceae bacterium]